MIVAKSDWRDDAACRSLPTQEAYRIFFPPEHDGGHNAIIAKRICRTCPVLMQCGEYIRHNPCKYGVWAGTTARERRGYYGPPRYHTPTSQEES